MLLRAWLELVEVADEGTLGGWEGFEDVLGGRLVLMQDLYHAIVVGTRLQETGWKLKWRRAVG
jgi:hypothetical protein